MLWKNISLATLGVFVVLAAGFTVVRAADSPKPKVADIMDTMTIHVVRNHKHAIVCDDQGECTIVLKKQPNVTPTINPNGAVIQQSHGKGTDQVIEANGGEGGRCPTWVLKNGIWYKLC